jgi:hypothetical protein
MADFRALCAELTDTLDYWLKNSNLTDSDARDLVQNARAALAQPEPQGLTDDELREMWLSQEWFNEGATFREFASIIRRWGRPAIKPVSVAERPWEREGWCDARGQCWWFKPADFDDNEPAPSWYLDVSPALKEIRFFGLTYSLPHHALPLPTSEGD